MGHARWKDMNSCCGKGVGPHLLSQRICFSADELMVSKNFVHFYRGESCKLVVVGDGWYQDEMVVIVWRKQTSVNMAERSFPEILQRPSREFTDNL